MEIEENYVDEMFDFNDPIQPEIYSTSSALKLISFDNSSNKLFNNNVSATNSIDDDELAEEYYNSITSITSQVIDFSSNRDNNNNNNNNNKVCTVMTGRTTLQARDHVVAERKRRENLSQLFIALSQVVPGLKKLDKASVLEDAINHLKDLQERVRVLEEETSKTNFINTYTTESSDNGAEIKARVSDKHVLIKIDCKKQKGLMSRVPGQLEKMHLNVLDMTIMPFGAQPLLHITLLAEMQSEFRGTVKDVVDHLQTLFVNPAC